MADELETDVLIIGCGIAGYIATLRTRIPTLPRGHGESRSGP